MSKLTVSATDDVMIGQQKGTGGWHAVMMSGDLRDEKDRDADSAKVGEDLAGGKHNHLATRVSRSTE